MGGTRDSIADVWGRRTPYRGEGRWPLRVDERVVETPDHWVRSSLASAGWQPTVSTTAGSDRRDSMGGRPTPAPTG